MARKEEEIPPVVSWTILAFIVILLLVSSLLQGCTDEDATRRTLENSGYTEIETTGYVLFACGEDDTFHTGFVATNPEGKRVRGTVCCGLIAKDCTIRY